MADNENKNPFELEETKEKSEMDKLREKFVNLTRQKQSITPSETQEKESDSNVHHTKLVNLTTNEVELIDNAQLLNTVDAGNYKLAPNEKVITKSPAGNLEWHNSNDWPQLIAAGYTIPSTLDISNARRVHKKTQKIKESPVELAKTILEAAGRGISFGATDVVLPAAGITDRESMAMRKKLHPAISTGSEIASVLGSLLIPGLGEAKVAQIFSKAGKPGLTAARLLSKATKLSPPALLSKAAREAAERAGGDLVARSVYTGLEMIPYGASSSITEGALGDPKAAMETLIPNIGLSVLLGAGIQGGFSLLGEKGLGLVGKTMRKVEEKANKSVLQRWWQKNTDTLSKELKSHLDGQTITFFEELKKGITYPESIIAESGLTPMQSFRGALRAKYPAFAEEIEKHVVEGITTSDLPKLQKIFVEASETKVKFTMQRMAEAQKNPEVVKEELSKFAEYVDDSVNIQTKIVEELDPKLVSLASKLKDNFTQKPIYKELLDKMQRSQLESTRIHLADELATKEAKALASNGKLDRSLLDKDYNTVKKIFSDVEKELTLPSKMADSPKLISSLDDYLSNTKQIPTKVKTKLEADLTEIVDRINYFENIIEGDRINYSAVISKALKNTRDKIGKGLPINDLFTGEMESIPLGINGLLKNNRLRDVFEELRKLKRSIQQKAGYAKANLSDADMIQLPKIREVENMIGDIIKNKEYFGEVGAFYNDFNKASSNLLQTKKEVLGKLFTRSKIKPTEGEVVIQHRGQIYRPNLNKVREALEGTNVESVAALENFKTAYKNTIDDYVSSTNKIEAPVAIAPLSDDILYLEHYSKTPGIKKFDPKKVGVGVKGEDWQRMGKGYLPRTYFYGAGQKPEHLLGSMPHKYYAKIPKNEVYNLSDDALNLRNVSKNDAGLLDYNLLEQNVKSAGFKGYYTIEEGRPAYVAMYESLTPYAEVGNTLIERNGINKLKNALPPKYAIITAQKPTTKPTITGGNKALERVLKDKNYDFKKIQGQYGGAKESSYLVSNPSEMELIELGQKFGQESIILGDKVSQKMVNVSGKNMGQYVEGTGMKFFEKLPKDNYSTIMIDDVPHTFSLNFDWAKQHTLTDNIISILKGKPVAPGLEVIRQNPNLMLKNLRDFETLLKIADGGASWSTGLMKEGSKYGPLGLGLYLMGVPLPGIAGVIALTGSLKHIQRNPKVYFEFITQIARQYHATRRLVNRAVRSKILEGAEISIVKGITAPDIKDFDKTKKMLQEYEDKGTRLKNLEATNDMDATIMPNAKLAYTEQLNGMIDYLQSKLPKGISMASPLDPEKEPMITSAEKRKFMEIYKYAENPYLLIQNFPHVSTDAIDAVKSLYPDVFKSIQEGIVKLMPDLQKRELTSVEKMAISKILEMPVDNNRSMDFYRQIQNNWINVLTPSPEEEKEAAPKPMTQGQAKAVSNTAERFKIRSQETLE